MSKTSRDEKKKEQEQLVEQQERDRMARSKAESELMEIEAQANKKIFEAQEIDRRVAKEDGQQNKALSMASRYESMTRVAIILKFGDPQDWDYTKDGKEIYGG